MSAKKSFVEEISKDFDTQPILESKSSTAKTKAMPGARLIPLGQIIPDPGQPRKSFDETSLEELYESVKSQGVIEPITVRQDGSGYVIITGERRFRAAKKAGLPEIPCVIRQASAEEAFACQIIENVQRQDLKPVDEAVAIQKLCVTVTQQEAAKVIGKSQPYVSKLLSISELPEEILTEAAASDVTKEHLFQVSKAADQSKAWEAVKHGRQAKDINNKKPKNKTLKPWTWKPDDKRFTVSVKFKKGEFNRQDLIKALERLLDDLRG
jgi:ParB/RepB/Spo0J family partition protein